MSYTSKPVYEYISRQTGDPIVERKTCAISGTSFPIFQSDILFYDKISTIIAGIKYTIPSPILCPEERQRRRLLFRNERKLYKRKCDATGENIISMYSPEKPYKVYKQDFRWSDNRDPMQYGKDFDFSKNFTDQFGALMQGVPLMSLAGGNNTNAEYVNLTADSKNCYIVVESSNNEDCYHCYWIQKCKNCCDVSFAHECELCYQVASSHNCTKVSYSSNCTQCYDSMLLENCTGCSNCFGCVNLQQKSYYIFNEPVDKEAYAVFMSRLFADSGAVGAELSEKFAILKTNVCKKYAHVLEIENCICEYMRHAKNCVCCIDGYDAENCRYSEHVRRNAKDIMDCSTAGRDASMIYEGINTAINVHHNICTAIVWESSYMLYCYQCMGCSNCFGCIALRNKSYCIFNKQYTKQEYEDLLSKIISHMTETKERGVFFDPSLSPFGYNETVAQEQFPLRRDDALVRSCYKRQDTNYDPVIPEGTAVLQGDKIPTTSTLVTDDILKKIFCCEISDRPFRLVKQELDFYRRLHLPLPRKHPDVRHAERIKESQTRVSYLRDCDKCGKEMVSVYKPSPTLPYQGGGTVETNNHSSVQNIYCEACYTKEVYG